MCGSARRMANIATQSTCCVVTQDQEGLVKELSEVLQQQKDGKHCNSKHLLCYDTGSGGSCEGADGGAAATEGWQTLQLRASAVLQYRIRRVSCRS